ncbi:MAG: hypothetical protein ABJF86_08525 [Tateyamaria sp.]|uniref:DUF7931 domain-containing protein n=1 Tax=Tateyamaria sp. TaxID=1929288 RepID=UPI0032832EB1
MKNMNIDTYTQHIDQMARAMDGSTVLNGSAEHAAVINERMFTHATRDVRILTRNLDPRVYGTSDLVESAELFLGMPDRKLMIAVENAPAFAKSGHPLVTALGDFENFEIREIPKSHHVLVDVNFTVVDGVSYRFERDKSQAVAVACFGDKTDFTTKLTEFFRRIWEISDPLNSPPSVTA